MDIIELYNIFQTLSPRKVNEILNEGYGRYSTIIKPINQELKGTNNVISPEMKTDNKVDTITRISIVHRFILWDILFYDKNLAFDARKFQGSYKKLEIVKAIMPILENEKVSKTAYTLLVSIISRWNEIRDYLYEEQKRRLLKCSNECDLTTFIQSNPYPEFSLFAKYRLCLIKGTPFCEAKTAIDYFPNSDLLPIDYFKKMCIEVNGIKFMLNVQQVFEDKEILEMLRYGWEKLISDFKPVHSNKHNYIQSLPINYSFLRQFVKVVSILRGDIFSTQSWNFELFLHDSSLNVSKDNEAVISTFSFFQSIIGVLNSLISGITFSLPNIDTLNNDQINELDYIWSVKELNSDDIKLIRCKDGKVFDVLNDVYAGCRMMLFSTND